MSLEGSDNTGSDSLDAVPEISASEIPVQEEPSPEMPEEIPVVPEEDIPKYLIENIDTPEAATEFLNNETEMANKVLDLTQNTIAGAEGATGNPSLFTEEEQELRNLREGLKEPATGGYTEEEKVNAIKHGTITFDFPGKSENDSPVQNEEVETIAPETDRQYDGKVVVNEAKIPVRNEEEEVLLREAAKAVETNSVNNLSVEQARAIISTLESIKERQLPGDSWYNALRAQEEYNAIQRPFRTGQNVIDQETGRSTPVTIISSTKENFSVANPDISLRDMHLDTDLPKNPRYQLEQLLTSLKGFKFPDSSPPVETVSEISETNTIPVEITPEIINTEQEIGGLGTTETTLPTETNEELKPEDLLEMESMPTEDFFKLDFDSVNNTLRRTAILSNENPNKVKAMKIIELLQNGKDSYLEENPEAEKVTF